MPKVKRTNDEWLKLLADQRASGQTQAKWCVANGVNLYTFRDRASRLRKIGNKPEPHPKRTKPAPAGWVEIQLKAPPEKTSGISIKHGGFSIAVEPGFDPELLTEVLRAVCRTCC